MGEYKINGGNRLYGEISIGGGKNAVLPILASVVLNKGDSVIHNCPKILDTYIAIDILKSIGCRVSFEGHTITVNSSGVDQFDIPEKLVCEMRSSIIFMGSMLGRYGKVRISYPGG